MPDLGSIHIDVGLTNISIMYQNDSLVADQVFPPLNVEKRSDKYWVYNRDAAIRGSGMGPDGKPKSLRRPGTVATEVDYTLSTDKFYCEEYASRFLVTDASLRLADNPLQPDIDATMITTERIKMDNELAVAATVGNLANYSAGYEEGLTNGAAGSSWASYTSANSDPFIQIKDGKVAVLRGVLKEANMMLINVEAARTLADHPLIKDEVKYTNPDSLTNSGLPKVLRGLNVLEAAQQVATNPEFALNVTTQDAWLASDGSTLALIYYKSMTDGPRTVHFGRTFEAPDDTTGARGFQVRRYRDEEKKGQYIEASTTRDWELISVDGNGKSIGGFLIYGCTN